MTIAGHMLLVYGLLVCKRLLTTADIIRGLPESCLLKFECEFSSEPDDFLTRFDVQRFKYLRVLRDFRNGSQIMRVFERSQLSTAAGDFTVRKVLADGSVFFRRHKKFEKYNETRLYPELDTLRINTSSLFETSFSKCLVNFCVKWRRNQNLEQLACQFDPIIRFDLQLPMFRKYYKCIRNISYWDFRYSQIVNITGETLSFHNVQVLNLQYAKVSDFDKLPKLLPNLIVLYLSDIIHIEHVGNIAFKWHNLAEIWHENEIFWPYQSNMIEVLLLDKNCTMYLEMSNDTKYENDRHLCLPGKRTFKNPFAHSVFSTANVSKPQRNFRAMSDSKIDHMCRQMNRIECRFRSSHNEILLQSNIERIAFLVLRDLNSNSFLMENLSRNNDAGQPLPFVRTVKKVFVRDQVYFAPGHFFIGYNVSDIYFELPGMEDNIETTSIAATTTTLEDEHGPGSTTTDSLYECIESHCLRTNVAVHNPALLACNDMDLNSFVVTYLSNAMAGCIARIRHIDFRYTRVRECKTFFFKFENVTGITIGDPITPLLDQLCGKNFFRYLNNLFPKLVYLRILNNISNAELIELLEHNPNLAEIEMLNYFVWPFAERMFNRYNRRTECVRYYHVHQQEPFLDVNCAPDEPYENELISDGVLSASSAQERTVTEAEAVKPLDWHMLSSSIVAFLASMIFVFIMTFCNSDLTFL